MSPFMMSDPLYPVIFGVAAVLSLIAQFRVKSSFAKWSKVGNYRNMSGAEAAAKMLASEGVTDVRILRQQSGFLSDNFNPGEKTINLSPDVYDGRSIAAVGVACHEAGHALQHADGYAPLKLRSAIIPVVTIGNQFGLPMVVLGAGLGWMGLATIGFILFSTMFLFQLITLPAEIDASVRSKNALVANRIVQPGPEADGVSSVLTAAAFTYIAAAVGSLLTLLYHAYRLGLIGGRSRND
ncbi:MAG: zinc metallopeptidase [Planctomycetota bacterium]|jgi:Zn-dependent membrane protease YugP|nr:zinc metallopeptidase [Planctomycetota bacterium]